MRETEDKPRVAMLLNIDHFFGEHEGRLGPTLIFLCVAFAPLLIYGYYSIYLFIPLKLFLPIFLFYVLRCGLIILGDEKVRLKNFLQQLNDIFAAMFKLMRIKTIHTDGCIEFIDGKIAYLVVTYNGTCENLVQRSLQTKKFQSLLVGEHSYDIMVQNIIDVPALENRYNNVKLFTDDDAGKDFIDIIDHNRKIVHKSSLLTRTIYVIRGNKSEWKDMKYEIKEATSSTYSKAYKSVIVIKDKSIIESIISKDVDGVVNIDEMLINKYCTKEYNGSYVSSYDDEDLRKPIVKEESEEGFHVKF